MDNTIGFSTDLATIAQLCYYLFLLVYIVFSLILAYHWKSYAHDPRVVSITLITYFLTTGTLIIIATGALFAI